jgi:hypothetical protein
MPLVAAVAVRSVYREGAIGRGARLGLVGLQAILVAGGLLALRTGEADEEMVERVVDHGPLEAHEGAGQIFVIAAGIVLLLAIVSAALRPGTSARWSTLATLLGTLAVLGLGLRAGSLGGALVYTHGAAAAHAPHAASGTERAAADPLATLKLDAGKKWRTDDHTRRHIALMATEVRRPTSDGSIGIRLREQLSALTAGCTMQGPAHDALHVYLSALASQIEAMQQTNPSAAQRAHEHAAVILGRFDDYFE